MTLVCVMMCISNTPTRQVLIKRLPLASSEAVISLAMEQLYDEIPSDVGLCSDVYM